MGTRFSTRSHFRLNWGWRPTDKALLIFDIDGVLAKFKKLLPHEQTPENYLAMEPTCLVEILRNQSRYPSGAHSNKLRIVYLTKRPFDTIEATQAWLDKHGIGEWPIYTVEKHTDKIHMIDEVLPEKEGANYVLAFDDRWEELLQSRYIRNTHAMRYGNKELVKRGRWGYGGEFYGNNSTVKYDSYESMAVEILRCNQVVFSQFWWPKKYSYGRTKKKSLSVQGGGVLATTPVLDDGYI